MTRLRLLPLLAAVLLATAAACALAPAGASAHARLEGSSPARDAVVKTQPRQVVFRFDEAVEGAFGAVRVFDARARRVDAGGTRHPGGRSSALDTGLKPGLPQGSYTATYRALSADGHPIEGGLVFSIGRAGAGPSQTIDELIGSAKAGRATTLAFGVVRALDLAAIALAIGLLVFLLGPWRRALAQTADDGSGAWAAGAAALVVRARRVLAAAALLGLAATALGLVFEGAVAGGTSFWAALDTAVLRDVLDTRFGTVWALKGGAWVLLLALVLMRRPPALLALPAAALAFAPAFSGHAATQGDRVLLVASDVAHVLAMSVWAGGLAALLLVLPRATAALDPPGRTRLLAAVLARFSPLALGCVVVLVATGTLQSVVLLQSFGDLTGDAFGRAILVKVALLAGLIGLGAVNRRTLLPRLRAAAAGGAAPGADGHLLRRTLRAEVATIAVVLTVTGALVGYAPPSATAGDSGPANVSTRLGPLQLEATIEPARVGGNTMHLYLFGARDGAPFDGTRELTVTAAQSAAGVGPLAVTVRKTGPGHYTAQSFSLVPGGTWTFAVTNRVSEFDQYTTRFTVKVRG